jgi:hypothetical protein
MENGNIIDKSKENLFKIPTFHPIKPLNPYQLKPIAINPLENITINPALFLSPLIKQKIGVK